MDSQDNIKKFEQFDRDYHVGASKVLEALGMMFTAEIEGSLVKNSQNPVLAFMQNSLAMDDEHFALLFHSAIATRRMCFALSGRSTKIGKASDIDFVAINYLNKDMPTIELAPPKQEIESKEFVEIAKDKIVEEVSIRETASVKPRFKDYVLALLEENPWMKRRDILDCCKDNFKDTTTSTLSSYFNDLIKDGIIVAVTRGVYKKV